MNLSRLTPSRILPKSLSLSRSLSISCPRFDDNVQVKKESNSDVSNEDLKYNKPEKVEPKPHHVQLYRVPDDETSDVPKKHCFQAITRKRLSTSVYTMEEAAKYVPMDMMFKSWKYPNLAEQTGSFEYRIRSYMNEHSIVFQYPDITDMMIAGGGLIGSATAYYIKKLCGKAVDVVVLDKDPYSSHNCTAFSSGLISVQSRSQDITRIANLSKELIRDLRNDVLVEPDDFAKINYQPCSHLVLWPERDLDEVINATSQQIQDGCFTESYLPQEVEAIYPWMKVSETDAALGTLSNQDEAIVDPIGLRNLYRTLGQAHGVSHLQAEAIDFNMCYDIRRPLMSNAAASAIVARIGTGELKQCISGKTLICMGHNTPFLETKAEMDSHQREYIEDLHFLQPKLRIYFAFNSEMAPVINFPVITETDGSMLMRLDHTGTFKYYLTLEESEKFFEEDNGRFMDIESDEPFPNLFHNNQKFADYFNNVIKPRLVKRVPLMEDSKFVMAASGFEDYNTFDGSPIMSMHPFHAKIMVSGGYGNRLMTFGPLAAYCYAELLAKNEEELFDITNFYWDRVFKNKPVQEFKNLIA